MIDAHSQRRSHIDHRQSDVETSSRDGSPRTIVAALDGHPRV